MSVLPDVFAGEDYVLPEGLLQAGVEFVAPARAEWRTARSRAAEQRWIQDQEKLQPLLESTRFSLNGVSSTRAYETRSTVLVFLML